MAHAGGRPSKLEDVIGERAEIDPTSKRPTGRNLPVTRTEQIVGDIRIGLNAERAAQRAGIDRETLKAWERRACELRQQIANSEATVALSDKDGALLDFSESLHAAELEWQVQCELLLQSLAQGGQEIVETHETTRDGKIVETRTITKVLLPDAKIIQWRLGKRFPEQYSNRVQITGTGEEGAIPVEVRAESIGAALAEWLQRRETANDTTTGPAAQQNDT